MNKITIILTTNEIDAFLETAINSVKSLYPIKLIFTSDLMNNNTNRQVEVVYFPFSNNFSDLKNFGLEGVGSEWILYLDSDEMVSPELLEEIPALIQDKDVEGYWIPRKTFISPDTYLKHGLFYPDYQLRLFRNKPEYKYVGAIHEQLTIPFEKTQKISSALLHVPRNPKYTAFSDFKNLLPYMHIQSDEIISTSTSSNSLAAVYYFFLGLYKSVSLFISGFFRGKGFLDGWNGFRAHFLLASSIGGAYILAAKKLLFHT